MPIAGAAPGAIGTITSASSAHIGAAAASTGTTVFGGDHLSTEKFGSVQIRAGAARLLLSGASSAALGQNEGTPSARLLSGTAVFSTANAKAFVLNAATAEIPAAKQSADGCASDLRQREGIASAQHAGIALDHGGRRDADRAGSDGVPGDLGSGFLLRGGECAGSARVGIREAARPLKAGKSHFLLLAIIVVSVATGVVLYEALQSPDRPK